MQDFKEFEYKGKNYGYELDGYKPLGVCEFDSEGNEVRDLDFVCDTDYDIYEAACQDAVQYLRRSRS